MYLLFVDESGTPQKENAKDIGYFVMAGLVIPENRWSGMRDKLVGLKRRTKYKGEIKWRYFAPNNKDDENPMKDWDIPARNSMRAEVFSIITETKSCKIIAGVSESTTAYALRNCNSQDDLYFMTYKPVTERFQYFLQDINREAGTDSMGIIVADHRGRGDDDSMRHRHERLLRETGNYTSSYPNFIEGLFFSPSHLSIGIQLVDMVAGAIWRAQAYNDRTWYDVLKPAMRCCPRTGKIDGFGIARVPKANWQGNILN
ncbi:DUF3800 domain-containing protein [Gluconacetobacter aggeris]|uniref:DUF3800 domain-containing protein n=1 Tax=Gluconacetobacter aggeris TaxID=1286186 RepID=A0A7W4IPL7_9PROT|nr:DUF3800 domain-containing protein [Gluconacetobacter aggeris]MBB2166760.1 DUF3800 domain-containing protein [Gluconacetobacter aggeris]